MSLTYNVREGASHTCTRVYFHICLCRHAHAHSCVYTLYTYRCTCVCSAHASVSVYAVHTQRNTLTGHTAWGPSAGVPLCLAVTQPGALVRAQRLRWTLTSLQGSRTVPERHPPTPPCPRDPG